MDFHFPQPSLMLAECDSIFRSTNQGLNWQRLPMSGKVRVHPLAPQRILAFSDTLSESTDQGLTWKQLTNDDLEFRDIQFHPENPQRLSGFANYIGSAGYQFGYFRSIDGGLSWIRATSSGIPSDFQTNVVLVIHSTNSNRQFAIFDGNRVLRTSNAGKTWTLAFHGPTEDLVLDPSSNSVYVGGVDGIFKSLDGGKNWFSTQCHCSVRQIAINPMNSSHIAAVGTDYNGHGYSVTSHDAGRSWSKLPLFAKHGYRSVAFDPFHRDRVLAGAIAAGIYKSTNGGRSFSPANRGLDALHAGGVVHDPASKTHFLSVTPVGLFETMDSGATWRKKNLPFQAAPGEVRIHPGNSRIWLLRGNISGIAISTDAGSTWKLRTVPQSNFLSWDPRDPNVFYVSPQAGKISRSTDAGLTWIKIGSGLPAESVYTLEVSPSNSNVLYLGAERRRIFVSTDAGKNWMERSSGLYNGGFGRVYQILLHPQNIAISYAIVEHHDANDEYPVLYKSTDSGRSWKPLAWPSTDSYPLFTPDEVLLNSTNPNQLFANDGDIIFASQDGGSSWRAVSNAGLEKYPFISFTDVDYAPLSNTLLGATEHGVFTILPE